MARDLRLFYLFRLLSTSYLWVPISQAFAWSRGLSLVEYMLLNTVYCAVVILTEVPTGALADRAGRRATMAGGALAMVAACLTFAVSASFTGFAIATALAALSMTLCSGADSAYLFDLLHDYGRGHEYPRREGTASAWHQGGQALAFLCGGLLGAHNLVLPYLATAGVASLAFFIALFMREGGRPPPQRSIMPSEYIAHTRDAFRLVASRRPLVWVIGYSSVVFVLLRATEHVYQPYLRASGWSVAETGVIYAGVYLVAAGVAHNFAALRRWLSESVLLWALLGTLIVTFLILGNIAGPLALVVMTIQNGGQRPLLAARQAPPPARDPRFAEARDRALRREHDAAAGLRPLLAGHRLPHGPATGRGRPHPLRPLRSRRHGGARAAAQGARADPRAGGLRGASGVACQHAGGVTVSRGFTVDKPSVYFVSLGCPKNRVDTEVMLGHTAGAGHQLVAEPEDGRRHRRQHLRLHRRGQAGVDRHHPRDGAPQGGGQLQAAGRRPAACRSATPKELADEMPEVDHFLGSDEVGARSPRRSPARVDRARRRRRRRRATSTTTRRRAAARWRAHTAYVKIAEGCDRPCAFCIIPKLRGAAAQPRRSTSVVREVARPGRAAAPREINLVAQDLTTYGDDLPDARRTGAPRLARCCAARRASTGCAGSACTTPIRPPHRRAARRRSPSEPRVAKYLDVPLQHIDERRAQAHAARPRRARRAASSSSASRARVPDVTLRTTFIVGHPGETDAAFQTPVRLRARGRARPRRRVHLLVGGGHGLGDARRGRVPPAEAERAAAS